MDWHIETETLLKLGIATLIGMVIGLEREAEKQAARLKNVHRDCDQFLCSDNDQH